MKKTIKIPQELSFLQIPNELFLLSSEEQLPEILPTILENSCESYSTFNYLVNSSSLLSATDNFRSGLLKKSSQVAINSATCKQNHANNQLFEDLMWIVPDDFNVENKMPQTLQPKLISQILKH